MTKIGKWIISAAILGILIAGLSGCEKEKGPMERAGQKMDNAIEKTGEQVDKATQKTGEGLEKAGDKIKDSVK
ncbi:MAG: Rv0909 family putative TA system antitoxin [Desulfuromonadaceae bacterium]|nr:Rv0909 family putative TA system antitoxin [Desulfuromonadaceae bacterium]